MTRHWPKEIQEFVYSFSNSLEVIWDPPCFTITRTPKRLTCKHTVNVGRKQSCCQHKGVKWELLQRCESLFDFNRTIEILTWLWKLHFSLWINTFRWIKAAVMLYSYNKPTLTLKNSSAHDKIPRIFDQH